MAEQAKPRPPSAGCVYWDSDIVDSSGLYTVLGYKSRDARLIGKEAFRRILDFETAVDRAQMRVWLTRVIVRDRASGNVIAHGYKRGELLALAVTVPGLIAIPSPESRER